MAPAGAFADAPAEASAGAVAADTEENAGLMVSGSLEPVLAVLPPWRCLVIEGLGTEIQKAHIDHEDVALELVDLGLVNNMAVAETHSEMRPVGEMPQAVVVVLYYGADREPVADYECQLYFQPSWNQRSVVKFSPH